MLTNTKLLLIISRAHLVRYKSVRLRKYTSPRLVSS